MGNVPGRSKQPAIFVSFVKKNLTVAILNRDTVVAKIQCKVQFNSVINIGISVWSDLIFRSAFHCLVSMVSLV